MPFVHLVGKWMLQRWHAPGDGTDNKQRAGQHHQNNFCEYLFLHYKPFVRQSISRLLRILYTKGMSGIQTSLKLLQQQKIAVELEFRARYPQVYDFIQTNDILSDQSAVISQFTSTVQDSAIKFTLEEYENTLKKLQDLVILPPSRVDPESSLYLEQQISELTGIEITAELDGYRLPYQMGVIKSLPHIKRHPTDALAAHQHVLEAGFREKRNSYGWSYETPEEYSLSLPLHTFPIPPDGRVAARKWYKFRKMLVINPIERKAVIAAVTDTQFSAVQKYQFGGSPELIRDLQAWSPSTLGHVLIFFLAKTNTHPYGPVVFRKPTL